MRARCLLVAQSRTWRVPRIVFVVCDHSLAGSFIDVSENEKLCEKHLGAAAVSALQRRRPRRSGPI